MPRSRSRSTPRVLLVGLALALSWAAACGSDAGPTASEDGVGIEDISDAEIVVAGDLAGLTPEQREQVRRILREARHDLLGLRRAVRAGEVTPERARRLARRIHERTIERLSEFLIEGQIEDLLERLREGRHARPDLDLTDEQRAAIESLREEFRGFVRELRERVLDGTLSAAEARALIRAEWRETRAAICGVLTDEQAAEARFCDGGAPAGGDDRGSGRGPGAGGGPPGS